MTVIEQQEFTSFVLQSGATADGSGSHVSVGGFNGAQVVEIINTGSGSCNILFEGSMNGTTWHTMGYQQVDNTLTPARSISAIAVTANFDHVYQLQELYSLVRATISGTTGTTNVTATLYAVAV